MKYSSLITLTALLFSACTHSAQSNSASVRQYGFEVHADFSDVQALLGDDACVPVTVTVTQPKRRLRKLEGRDNGNFKDFRSESGLTKTSNGWQWELSKTGGQLSYCTQLNHRRGDNYDSKITANWALFRAEDLFPSATSIAGRSAQSKTQLVFSLPPDWTSVAAYAEPEDDSFRVRNPERRFDRPTGWVQLGELGVRRDKLAGTRVAVSAPVGQEINRLEILTFLSFTMPEVRDWFPDFPKRLLVVSATEKMWRGALSGPNSLFLHGERPLVSENGTSTVLHELVHVAMQRRAADDADWIDEGLAEYLSLVLLRQAGGLTSKRFDDAIAWQKNWGQEAPELATKNSSGAATAKAVGMFADLHNEMGDELFRALVKNLANAGPEITPGSLKQYAEQLSGRSLHSLP